MNVLITGGGGFIGSNLAEYWLKRHPNDRVAVLDKGAYGDANRRLLPETDRLTFEEGDAADRSLTARLLRELRIDGVIHAAAQSHVDASIRDPVQTAQDNFMATAALLEESRRYGGVRKFHLVSTDEVFGSLSGERAFSERSAYRPNNPYSASKAGADHLTRAYGKTYGMNVSITHCSNNYGPRQYPDKFLPKMICAADAGEPLTIYGDGSHRREWLYVEDHCRAIDLAFRRAPSGESYCVGGGAERRNIDLARKVCALVDEKRNRARGETARQIRFVEDRPGHDARYALDSSKIARELGWRASTAFEAGLRKTVDWYLARPEWVESALQFRG